MTNNPIKGGFGDDNLTGTGGNDIFNLARGGNDTVHAGGGDDIFWMGVTLNAGDKLDGGDGIDQLNLNGDYSAGLVLGADTITNIEKIYLAHGHSYNLTTNDGNVADGAKLLVNAQSLGAGDSLTFNGAAETDGRFNIYAGAGDDTITGGALNDTFHLEQGGVDTVHGGGGNDTFDFGTSFTGADTVDGGAGRDTLALSKRPFPGRIDKDSGRPSKRRRGRRLSTRDPMSGGLSAGTRGRVSCNSRVRTATTI
jgi:Ca2+-binding RTX toxin-like protein